MTLTRENRIVGSLLAGAIGDALGAGLEFFDLSTIENVFGPEGATTFTPAFGLEAPITDDTQMTLFTAEGLIEAHRNDSNPLEEVWSAYQRWYHTQGGPLPEDAIEGSGLLGIKELFSHRAPGGTCIRSVKAGNPGSTTQQINRSKGCGGIMRVAPVGLTAVNKVTAYQLGCDIAALTHGHRNGWIPAGVQSVIIHQLLEGKDLTQAVQEGRNAADADPLGKECVELIDKAIALSSRAPFDGWDLEEALGGGWVGEEALAITIAVSLAEQDDINKALLLAVNHSGDSDSTGAMVGNVLGALHGSEPIRKSWQEEVELATEVTGIAKQLVEVSHEV